MKYKAKPDNIDTEHLISRAERFKEFAPVYKNHNIYLGVAAMSFKKGLASELHKAGIVTIHPIGKKMVIYDKKARVFWQMPLPFIPFVRFREFYSVRLYA